MRTPVSPQKKSTGVVSNLNRFVKTRKLVLNLGKTDSMTFSTNNKTFLEPADIKRLTPGAIWRFARAAGLL
jgi:hypothetical protein